GDLRAGQDLDPLAGEDLAVDGALDHEHVHLDAAHDARRRTDLEGAARGDLAAQAALDARRAPEREQTLEAGARADRADGAGRRERLGGRRALAAARARVERLVRGVRIATQASPR